MVTLQVDLIYLKILPEEAARQFTSTLVMLRGAYNQFISFVRSTAVAIGSFFKAFGKRMGQQLLMTLMQLKVQ